jgi:hypothetical protein
MPSSAGLISKIGSNCNASQFGYFLKFLQPFCPMIAGCMTDPFFHIRNGILARDRIVRVLRPVQFELNRTPGLLNGPIPFHPVVEILKGFTGFKMMLIGDRKHGQFL